MRPVNVMIWAYFWILFVSEIWTLLFSPSLRTIRHIITPNPNSKSKSFAQQTELDWTLCRNLDVITLRQRPLGWCCRSASLASYSQVSSASQGTSSTWLSLSLPSCLAPTHRMSWPSRPSVIRSLLCPINWQHSFYILLWLVTITSIDSPDL